MIETLRSDYVQMARLNGFRERTVVCALRAAKRARAERAGLRAEHPVPDRRHHRRRVPLRVPGHRQGARRRASASATSAPSSRSPSCSPRSTSASTSSPTCSSCCSCRSSGRRHESDSASSGRKPASSGSSSWLSSSGWRCSGRSSRRTRPTETIAPPFEDPSGAALLGTDVLGRDVLSRVLWGGRSVLALALLATAIAYAGRARRSASSPATTRAGSTGC